MLTENMKLLICTGIFPPAVGGPATYSKSLAEALSTRGHEVRVITYADRKSEQSEVGSDFPIFRIIRSRFKPWHYFKYYLAAKNYGRDADVLFAQDPVSAGYPTYLAARALKKPFIVKVTGDYSWEQAQGRGRTKTLLDEFQKQEIYPFPINKIRDVQIRVCREAMAVITPSAYLKRIVMGWGVKEKRITVIYNAVCEVQEFDREAVRQELGISGQDFVILSIGRDVQWKGFGLLREVVAEISKPNLKLVILHDADRQTSDKYLNGSDLFVLNTGYEGFSHTILEAMSAGLPVITTKVGGNPEVIVGDQNGILIEYNSKTQLREAILKLSQDPQLRQSLAENGKKILPKFALENMINQTEALLKRCAS